MSARILVVDDSPTIRKVVCSILEASEFLALPAQDGQEALDLLVHEKVDLVLLDFVMPRMNGYQFCREMRADESISHLPVVLMSAKGDKIRGQFVQQTGAVDAITKPFDARALLAVVENALQRAAEGRIRQIDSIPVEEDIPLTELEDRSSGTVPANDDATKRDTTEGIAKKLAEVAVAALSGMPESRRKDSQEVASTIRKALVAGALDDLTPLFAGLDRRGEGPEGFGGTMQVIPLAEVLQVLQLQRQTGTCKITNGKV
ncbi:MAG TPA: response regulator, partial [Polyangiaceae bacterium]|nr:response regulator [Polyangiaceae bacterium]